MAVLVPNAKEVATRAASMWAIYGAFAIDIAIKVLQYIQDNREMKWQDMVVPIALIVVGAARLMQQQSLATATERRLEAEQLTAQTLAQVAVSPGPPITKKDVADIKRDAAIAASLTTPKGDS